MVHTNAWKFPVHQLCNVNISPVWHRFGSTFVINHFGHCTNRCWFGVNTIGGFIWTENYLIHVPYRLCRWFIYVHRLFVLAWNWIWYFELYLATGSLHVNHNFQCMLWHRRSCTYLCYRKFPTKSKVMPFSLKIEFNSDIPSNFIVFRFVRLVWFFIRFVLMPLHFCATNTFQFYWKRFICMVAYSSFQLIAALVCFLSLRWKKHEDNHSIHYNWLGIKYLRIRTATEVIRIKYDFSHMVIKWIGREFH